MLTRSRVVDNRFHRLGALFIGLVTSITAPALAETWFVDGWVTQSGTGTGTWSNAKKYLQEVLDVAIAGDVVNIATGIYYVADGVPSGSIPQDPRDLSFVIPNGVELRGGWPTQGGDTDTDEERSVVDFPVTLSGDRLKDDPIDEPDLAERFDQQLYYLTDCNEDICGTYADNVYHVVTASGVTDETLLVGVTIRGGHADGLSRAATARASTPPTARRP